MITVAMVTRRLKEGKTYEDFRKAWYHTVGFGADNKLYTMINTFDPREIIVIGFVEASCENLLEGLRMDVKERLENPLDDVIEPTIERKFGILVAEDDFSAAGPISYQPAKVAGKETDLVEFGKNLQEVARIFAQAAKERDTAKKQRDRQ